ncbi:hypothetical protein [Methylobacterium symbioticum]|uniref:Uncharacterized protein n=1 Tax=Methylobacterium symbioticum TaxID=2584084 RepID=A0A509E8Q8_9HYPH|nr:hypothetical protein [Methylobacterium symbioticum]VUD70656.1 hypothetical protein MET9862_01228 [Methylobacterium symbioticum]
MTAQPTIETPATPATRSVPRGQHEPTSRAAVQGCLTFFNDAVAHCQGPTVVSAPKSEHLLLGLPHGSINAAFLQDRPQGPVIGWRIGDRSPRFTVPTGFLILRALCLFGGFPFIDTNKKGGREQHYVEVLAEGYTLQRLMVGAEPGEVVRLLGDHHDLLPWCLSVEGSHPRAKRDRRGAIRLALALYDKNAADWGLADLLSRAQYEALLRGAFRLYDAEHAHHLLRPIGS